MCGITGIFGKDVDEKTLESMLEVAKRRGPEDSKTKRVANGIVGHSLLGFVEEGNNPQPFVDGDSWIVYNGEVYNWRELNSKYGLEAKTDTQALLRGLKQKGADFLKEIDGQFAYIAQVNGETVVGRDKWGISPLVYGKNKHGQLAIASTPEALVDVQQVKAVPAGSYGRVEGSDLKLDFWFELPRVPVDQQKALSPHKFMQKATDSVVIRIPENTEILYTAMGGIDSQFITTTVARNTNGKFGGAITVVPWNANDPDNKTLGDYHAAKATIRMLREEGVEVNHHVVQLTPQYVRESLDRVIKVLGPDYFNICCGLPEDLVATTARMHGGKAIMTAGGPDEAGRSYKPWTLMHKDRLEEGFYAINDQFASAEGVRAGLVFGEQGLENRVPLAFMIEDMMYARPEQKQEVLDWGDGKNPLSIQMKDKILWRKGLEGILPEQSLREKKETIHGATGTKETLYHVLQQDSEYQANRQRFIQEAKKHGWNGIVFDAFDRLDPQNKITEGQLYCLYRWSKLEPERFKEGGEQRYGLHVEGSPRYSSTLADKIARPICFDWLPL